MGARVQVGDQVVHQFPHIVLGRGHEGGFVHQAPGWADPHRLIAQDTAQAAVACPGEQRIVDIENVVQVAVSAGSHLGPQRHSGGHLLRGPQRQRVVLVRHGATCRIHVAGPSESRLRGPDALDQA